MTREQLEQAIKSNKRELEYHIHDALNPTLSENAYIRALRMIMQLTSEIRDWNKELIRLEGLEV